MPQNIEQLKKDVEGLRTQKDLKQKSIDKHNIEIEKLQDDKDEIQKKIDDMLGSVEEGKISEVEYRLSLIKYPSGTYGFVGKVPVKLAFVAGATAEEIEKARKFGGKFGPKRRSFETPEEARDAANELNVEFDDTTIEEQDAGITTTSVGNASVYGGRANFAPKMGMTRRGTNKAKKKKMYENTVHKYIDNFIVE